MTSKLKAVAGCRSHHIQGQPIYWGGPLHAEQFIIIIIIIVVGH